MMLLDHEACHQARLARDHRYDGQFFTAVKTTQIFCRPICPASPPHEKNVTYFRFASEAMAQGYRPCLRCRPDSAPGSYAWKGVHTTVGRAIRLMEQAFDTLTDSEQLSERLGVSPRYLRRLFQQHVGMSPMAYLMSQRLLFAKKLLHESTLSVTEIAYQCGFESIRTFNRAFKQHLKLVPSDIKRKSPSTMGTAMKLQLSYRPPLNWQAMLNFWRVRGLEGMEWVAEDAYGRTFYHQGNIGEFTARRGSDYHLEVEIDWPYPTQLFQLTQALRRFFDLDANMAAIDEALQAHPLFASRYIEGLRIPATWSPWEAGVRAILGQQVSVQAARTQCQRLLDALGGKTPSGKRLFPTPAQVASNDLTMIKVPQARRDTLKALARFLLETPDAPPDDWRHIKGVGPWTVQYVKLRGLSEADIWMGTDLGVKKALALHGERADPALLSPWRSYATFQLWNG